MTANYLKPMTKTLGFLTLTLISLFSCEHLRGDPFVAPEMVNKDSIYHISAWTDGSLIAATNALSLSAFAFRYNIINRRCPCDPNEVNSFDRPAIYNSSSWAGDAGTATVAASLLAPIAVDYFDDVSPRAFAEDMVVFAETMSVNWFLVTASKFSFQRPLPRLYARQVQGEPTDYLAFYSGHTCTATAAMTFMATTFTLRHGFKALPWIAAGVFGASVAYEMVASAGHYPSDVIVGFMMGGAVGVMVPLFHTLKNDNFMFLPLPQGALALWRYDL